MRRSQLQRKTALRQTSPKKAVSIKASVRRLKQGRSTGKPTAAQVKRFEHIKAIGCIACLLYGRESATLPEVHHLNAGGYHGAKRRGHDFTVGLCKWHHQGVLERLGEAGARLIYGPSYKLHKKAFRELYGSDDDLLTLQNQLIALREAPCN